MPGTYAVPAETATAPRQALIAEGHHSGCTTPVDRSHTLSPSHINHLQTCAVAARLAGGGGHYRRNVYISDKEAALKKIRGHENL
eukprot:SAG11_NODE_431_length_9526_cov_11.297019_10_plen_84_part_01